ncbi:RNA polymerase subunit AC19 [Maublancomyces gigas]|uniref:RNA polymerase subunit AC19 n=1 Tax=Discina gigas TaxID=1032678 RepID=A0ABR3GMW7_9PEZI
MASGPENTMVPRAEDMPMDDLSEIDDDEPLVEEEASYNNLRITTVGLLRFPEVEFCGYSIPHPSEERMNIRIQIYPEYWETTKPYDVLLKGFDDLVDLCDHVTGAFSIAKNTHGKHEDK